MTRPLDNERYVLGEGGLLAGAGCPDPDDGRRPPDDESANALPPRRAFLRALPPDQLAVVTVLACSKDPLRREELVGRVWSIERAESELALLRLEASGVVQRREDRYVLP